MGFADDEGQFLEDDYWQFLEDYYNETHPSNQLSEYELFVLRDERLTKLLGKFVIMQHGRKSLKTCYFQDQTISCQGWWTNYLSNAYGYNSKKAAQERASKYKYGNCSVIEVTQSMIDKQRLANIDQYQKSKKKVF